MNILKQFKYSKIYVGTASLYFVYNNYDDACQSVKNSIKYNNKQYDTNWKLNIDTVKNDCYTVLANNFVANIFASVCWPIHSIYKIILPNIVVKQYEKEIKENS